MSRALDDILDAHQDVDAALTAYVVDRRQMHLDAAWTAGRELMAAIRKASRDREVGTVARRRESILKLKHQGITA